MDSGATGYAYIDHGFVEDHALVKKPLSEFINLRMFNGEIATESAIQEETSINLVIEQEREGLIVKHNDYRLSVSITKLGGYPLVLGISWLRKHEPSVAWKTNKLEFISTYC